MLYRVFLINGLLGRKRSKVTICPRIVLNIKISINQCCLFFLIICFLVYINRIYLLEKKLFLMRNKELIQLCVTLFWNTLYTTIIIKVNKKNLQKHNMYTTKELRKKRTPTKDLIGCHSDVLNLSQILDKDLEQKCGQKAWFVRTCF